MLHQHLTCNFFFSISLFLWPFSVNDADFTIFVPPSLFVINAMPSRGHSPQWSLRRRRRAPYWALSSFPNWNCFSCCCLVSLFFLNLTDIYFSFDMSNSGPPHISGSVTSKQTFRLGETVKLDCPIRGTPTPIVEWYKVNICFALQFSFWGVSRRHAPPRLDDGNIPKSLISLLFHPPPPPPSPSGFFFFFLNFDPV